MPSEQRDELSPIPIDVPYDLDRQLGYDNATGFTAGCDGVLIGFWVGIDGSVVVTDGYTTHSGRSRGYNSWDQEAGRKLLLRAAEEYEQHSPEDVPEGVFAPKLSSIIRSSGYEIGSPETCGDDGFLLDRRDQSLYVGDREVIRQQCRDTNDPPDIVSELPDDPDEAFRTLQDALSDDDGSGDLL